MTKLQSLQSIVELNEFLKFIDTNHHYSTELSKKVENLINLWSHSMPNECSDPPATWDDVITNRCVYFEFIEDKYYVTSGSNKAGTSVSADSNNVSLYDYSMLIDHNDDLANKKQLLKKVEKFKIGMQIQFAKAAQFQGKPNL